MKSSQPVPRLQRLMAWAAVLSMLWTAPLPGCAADEPLPQPRKVADPADIPGGVRTDRWELAAVKYHYLDQGVDYTKAGLAPVCLVVKNTSETTPVIKPQEARAKAPDGEYLPYTVDEAVRLVMDSEQFDRMLAKGAQRGAVGAAVGAGLGALFGLIGGGDAVWKGAAVGGGVGGVVGAGSAIPGTEKELRQAVEHDLYSYAWTDEPIPPDFTKVGYLYFPGGRNITAVSVTLRGNETVKTYRLELHGMKN
ncbi:MAG: hypothetical protein ACOCVM_07455 [Desulfovibrionaceae bacterium]